jgi:Ca2+-binding RTX toxin-like protein
LDITIAGDVDFDILQITSGTAAATDSITTVTVAGTGDINFNAATAANAVTDADALTLVDASALEGGITITHAAASSSEILGGTGDNTIDITGDSVTVTTQGGDDAITVTGNTASVTAGSGDDTVAVTGSSATVLGGAGDDEITASADGTVDLNGGAGDDTIDISASTDEVSSSDTIDGGAGIDTLVIDVTDAATLTFFDNFEKIVFSSASSDSATIDATSLTAFSAVGVAGDAKELLESAAR